LVEGGDKGTKTTLVKGVPIGSPTSGQGHGITAVFVLKLKTNLIKLAEPKMISNKTTKIITKQIPKTRRQVQKGLAKSQDYGRLPFSGCLFDFSVRVKFKVHVGFSSKDRLKQKELFYKSSI
jgi:hypothetical protein